MLDVVAPFIPNVSRFFGPAFCCQSIANVVLGFADKRGGPLSFQALFLRNRNRAMPAIIITTMAPTAMKGSMLPFPDFPVAGISCMSFVSA